MNSDDRDNCTQPIILTDRDNIRTEDSSDVIVEVSEDTESRILDTEIGKKIKPEKGYLKNPKNEKNFIQGKLNKRFGSNGGNANIKDVELTFNEDGSVTINGEACNKNTEGRMWSPRSPLIDDEI